MDWSVSACLLAITFFLAMHNKWEERDSHDAQVWSLPVSCFPLLSPVSRESSIGRVSAGTNGPSQQKHRESCELFHYQIGVA
jgi:hypothetical protein